MSRAPERFQLSSKLGAGGTSVVYRAYDRIRDMPVALKELRRVEPRRLYAFKREFRSLADLCHPNLVTLYDLVCEGERWYLTMEMVAGGDFLSYVRRAGSNPKISGGPVFATTSAAELRTLITEVFRHSDGDEAQTIDVWESTPPATTLETASLDHTIEVDPDTVAAAAAVTVVEGGDGADSSDDDSGFGTGFDTDVVTAENGRVAGIIGAESSRSDADATRSEHPRPELSAFIDVDRFVSVLRQLAGAVYALHQADLIHRDLKPSNVLVTEDGRVVIVDFGIVAELGLPQNSSVFDVIAGTPAFMAPEQVRGDPPSPAADWYAVGVMMYLCLTGFLPHRGTIVEIIRAKGRGVIPPPPRDLVRGVPANLDALCMELLRRNPDTRPTGAEVVERLGIARSDISVLTAPGADIFVGRRAQQERLRELGDAVAGGASAVVLVEGRSGMGKTTLIKRFCMRVSTDEEALVFTGRCHDNESLTYRAWDGVIDQLLVYLSGLSAIARAPLIDEDMRPLGFAFPVLCGLPEFDVTGLDRPQSSDTLVRAGVGLRRLLAALAATKPVLLVVDDLQWTDVESLHLMDAVLREPPARLMVLATLRSDSRDEASRTQLDALLDRLDRAGLCHRIPVEPLSPAEQHQLMAEMAATLGLSELAIDDEVRVQSGGHPMLLAELVRCVGENPDAQSVLTGADAGPSTIAAVLRRRIAHLAEPARALLEAVAVCTEPTPLSAAGQCARIPVTERTRLLVALRSAQLIRIAYRRREPWLDTHHSTIRSAVLDELSEARFGELHERMARALEQFQGAAGKVSPARLAEHWRAAGQMSRAAPYYLSAADQAYAQLAIQRSVTLYRQAIAALEAPVDALMDNAPVEATMDGASVDVTIDGATVDVTMDDGIVDVTVDVSVEAGGADEVSLCSAYLGLARGLRMSEGGRDELLDALQRAQELGERNGLLPALAEIHYLRGALLFIAADRAGCLAAHGRAHDLGAQLGMPAVEARALSGMGDANMISGHWTDARQYYRRCIESARAHKLIAIEEANLPMMAYMHWLFDELPQGLEALRRAAALARQCGAVRARVLARAMVAPTILLDMQRVPEASVELDIGLPLAVEYGLLGMWSHGMVHLGRCQWLEGRREEAVDTVERALVTARETRMALSGPLCLGLLYRMAERDARRTELLAEFDAVLERGAGAISVISSCADIIDAGLERDDLGVVERYIEVLEGFFAEPPPLVQFTVARARALVGHGRAPEDPAGRAELARLRALALRTGRRYQAQALDAALAAGAGAHGLS